MGLVKKTEEQPAEEEPEIIKRLKAVEDKYLEVDQDYDRKLQQLVLEYTAKQQPLLDQRKALLSKKETEANTGTPALSGFWLQALKNHPAVQGFIQEYDEPVLQYMQDADFSFVDPEDSNKGFKLKLTFAENPYFTNTILEKEYKTELENPYCGQTKVLGISCSTVEWKEGKDVTVEKVAPKKVKGGGAKKAKQKNKAGKEECRPSFFRDFFRELLPGMDLPEDAKMMVQSLRDEEDDDEDDGDDSDEQLVAQLMDHDFEAGSAFKDDIVPRAVRWYTGEAAPEDDDDDDDDDDDEEDESSEEESPPPKAKAKAKKGTKSSPELKAQEAPKQEECKQQ